MVSEATVKRSFSDIKFVENFIFVLHLFGGGGEGGEGGALIFGGEAPLPLEETLLAQI